jgi:hypothetical protein
VTLFASFVNLIVDYLFVDILSAPTADALKVTLQETLLAKTMRRVSNVNLSKKTSPLHPPFVQPSVTKLPLVQDLLLLSVETRIVPQRLADAHTMAMESFNDLMSTSTQEGEDRRSQRLQLGEIKEDDLRFPSTLTPSPSPLASQQPTSSGDLVDVDRLLSALKEELREERSLIRRPHEQEAFDFLWG